MASVALHLHFCAVKSVFRAHNHNPLGTISIQYRRGRGEASKVTHICQALRDDSPGGWQEDGELDADVRRALDNSKEQLDLIIKEVCDKVIMAEAMAILSGNEQSTSAEDAAIREAVDKRIDMLDQAFLATCNAYSAALEASGSAEVAMLVRKVRDATLASVTERMPAPVKLLEALLGEHSREARRDLVRECAELDLSGGVGDATHTPCPAASLVAAATQVIDDMEDKAQVPDRRLLAKLCLVREDARAVDRTMHAEGRYGDSDGKAPCDVFPPSLPRLEVALLSMMLQMERPGMRNKAWEALQKDNEGAVPAEALGSLPKSELAGLEERLRRTGKEGRNEEEMPGPPECVRPGRLLTALAALELEIVSTLPDFEVRQVEKLREVRSVCMDVLEDIAMTGSSSSASGDPEYGPDPPAFSA